MVTMKVKFVGGPYHGKTKDVNLRPGDPLMVGATYPRNVSPWSLTGSVLDSMVTIKQHRYEMRMMGVTIDGIYYKAPAMHPDGSIFLVHEDYKGGK